MTVFKIIASKGGRVVFDERVEANTPREARRKMKERLGIETLSGIVYAITEIPLYLIKQIVAEEIAAATVRREGGNEIDVAALEVPVKNGTARLEAIAHKRGFVAWHCQPGSDGRLPDSVARRKIEREVTKSSYEHFIVFTDSAKTRQVWQWVRREQGRPLRVREFELTKGQSGAAILQKLDPLFVSLEDEEIIDLTAVASRAAANVSERVTRRFYEDFKKQHTGFLKFITGIPHQGDHEWYASVMLNRLMFVYFIQKKGFLDGDADYLRNRLNALKAKSKGDKFYSFDPESKTYTLTFNLPLDGKTETTWFLKKIPQSQN